MLISNFVSTGSDVMWQQKKFTLAAKPRGFHLVSNEVKAQLPEIKEYSVGLLHLFIQHTSASLLINENADPTVRHDFEQHLNVMVPEGSEYYLHTYEGPDDMPAHIKASMLGTSLSIPICLGSLQLGVWQGIYLGEHRDHAHGRTLIATLNGQKFAAE